MLTFDLIPILFTFLKIFFIENPLSSMFSPKLQHQQRTFHSALSTPMKISLFLLLSVILQMTGKGVPN